MGITVNSNLSKNREIQFCGMPNVDKSNGNTNASLTLEGGTPVFPSHARNVANTNQE